MKKGEEFSWLSSETIAYTALREYTKLHGAGLGERSI
jgi:hypothetical protein